MKMKWAVEQSYFDNGNVRVRVRKAEEGETPGCQERKRCDFYIDLFDSEKEARQFAQEAKRA